MSNLYTPEKVDAQLELSKKNERVEEDKTENPVVEIISIPSEETNNEHTEKVKIVEEHNNEHPTDKVISILLDETNNDHSCDEMIPNPVNPVVKTPSKEIIPGLQIESLTKNQLKKDRKKKTKEKKLAALEVPKQPSELIEEGFVYSEYESACEDQDNVDGARGGTIKVNSFVKKFDGFTSTPNLKISFKRNLSPQEELEERRKKMKLKQSI